MSQMQDKQTEEQEDSMHGRFLTFYLGNEIYGIEIRFVTEIIGMQPITSLPEVPDYLRGIINLRGKIVPVIDVRLRFKMDAIPYNDRTCIVVVDTKDISVGLIVDSVAEVASIDDEDLVKSEIYGEGFRSRYIQGIGKTGDDVKLLLDCEKLFLYDEVQQLKEFI